MLDHLYYYSEERVRIAVSWLTGLPDVRPSYSELGKFSKSLVNHHEGHDNDESEKPKEHQILDHYKV